MTAAKIDFLQLRPTPWLGWCLFSAGVCAMVMSMWTHREWSTQRAESEAAQRRRDDAVQQARSTASLRVPPTAEELQLQLIAPQLRQPWLPVLRLIENVTEPPVFLLAIFVDPATGAVRLEGEAPSFADTLAYSKVLDEEGVMEPAQLRSHDAVNDPATGRQSVRFSIATRWVTK